MAEEQEREQVTITPEIQAVLDKYGFTEQELAAWLNNKVAPASIANAGGNFAIVQLELADAGITAPSVTFGDELSDGTEQVTSSGETITVEEEARELQDVLNDIATAAPGSQELAELQQEGYELAEGDSQGMLALQNLIAQTQGTDPRLQGILNANGWSYDIQGQGVGEGDDNLWYGMWQYAVNSFGTDLPPALALDPAQVPEGVDYVQWVSTRFQSWLASNPEGAQQNQLVYQYGEDYGHKPQAATLGEAGTSFTEVAQVANILGVSTAKAAKIIDMGARRDLDANQSATLYRFAVREGLIQDDPKSDSIIPTVNTSQDPQSFWGNIFGTAIDIGVQMVGGEEAARTMAEKALGVEDKRPDWLRGYEELAADPMHQTMVTSNQLFGNFAAGIDKYGTEIPALVSLTNKDLADRLVQDPYGLSLEERRGIWDMVGDDPELKQMMSASFLGQAQLQWLQGMGGGGESLIKVDKESVRDATRTLLSSWNLPGMSDGFVDSVANSFAAGQKVAAQNSIGNPFNPEFSGAMGPTQRVVDNPIDKAAHAKKAIRGTAAYQKYFSNKGDLSEEEYVNRFESEANRMLGHGSEEATRAGMLSGDRSDVGQHAIASGEFKDSSTFQGRLARLADAFRSET